MTREELINLLASKMKLVRTEANYTQDRMAYVIGVSKKTLVQIEKGRIQPSWTTVVAVCALFREQDTLTDLLGGDALEIAELISRDEIVQRKEKTMGGKVWWKDVEESGLYTLQRNVISQHFRIIDRENFRVYSTFEEKDARARLRELQK